MKKISILMLFLLFAEGAAPMADTQMYNDSDDAVSVCSELAGYDDTSDDDWDRASDGPGQIVPNNYDCLSDEWKALSLVLAVDGAIEAQRDGALDLNVVRHTLVLVYGRALELGSPVWISHVLQKLLSALEDHYQIIWGAHCEGVDHSYEYDVCCMLHDRWLKKLRAMLRLQKNLA